MEICHNIELKAKEYHLILRKIQMCVVKTDKVMYILIKIFEIITVLGQKKN